MTRTPFLLTMCLAANACGGEIGTSTDEDAAAATVSCDRNQGAQEIGTAPGVPWRVVSAGGSTFVASTTIPDDADGVASTQSTLYRLDAGGGSHAVTDNFVDAYSVTTLGANVGFLRVVFDPSGAVKDDAVETVDSSGTTTTLDSADDGGSFSDLTSDGSSMFAWYRWPTARRLAVPVVEQSAIGRPSTKLVFNSDVTAVGSFVTDGTSYYGVFETKDAGFVVGRMPVGSTTPLVFANGADRVEMLGVDATNVYYLDVASSGSSLSRILSAPKTGGTPTELVEAPIDNFDIIVREGTAYWVDHQATQDNIMSLPLSVPAPLSETSVSSFPISTIGANDCGLLFASESVNPGSATVFQLAL